MSQKAKEFAKNWQYDWFGFWAEEEHYLGKPFDIENHIDEDWSPPDKSKIVNYLKESPIVIVSQDSMQKCPFYNECAIHPSAFCSDGFLLWTYELSHYIDKHCFRLPEGASQLCHRYKYSELE